MLQVCSCIVALLLAAAAWSTEASDINGFLGPVQERAMEDGRLYEDLYATIGICAQRCDSSSRCKSFSWQARGDGLVVTTRSGNSYELRHCVLSRVNQTSANLSTYELYDFYEETAVGPTPHPGEDAHIEGYIGPFNGTSSSGIDDITDIGGLPVQNAGECADLCTANSECRSFDYGARGVAEGNCHLSRVDRAEAGQAFTVWPLYDYYEKVLESISEVLEDDSRFSILADAILQDAQLLSLLSGTGPFTLFAPTDQAFQYRAINSAADLLGTPGYQRLLEYHIVYGRFEAATLEDNDKLLTVHGEQVHVDRSPGEQGVVTVGGARIVTGDLACSNGLIHVMDNILSLPVDQEPESIMEMLQSRGFTSVEQAMIATGLGARMESSPYNWTFFAPSDTALTAFRITEGYSDVGEFLDSPGLYTLLTRHIILNRTIETTQADSGSVVLETMAGNLLTLQRTPGGSYFVHGEEAEVVAAVGPFDLWATDGVLHAVDRVLAEPERVEVVDGPRIVYIEVEKESDDDDDDERGAKAMRFVLPLLFLLICLCCPCVFYAGYRWHGTRPTSQKIEEYTMPVPQDGVTVVMGKPVDRAGEAKNNKAGDLEAVAGLIPGSNDAAGNEEKTAPTYARAPTR